MKNSFKIKISIFILLFVNVVFGQNVVIPDNNFKNALLEHGVSITSPIISKIDINDDGEIQVSEALAYQGSIDVANKNIADLTGIEAFHNVKYLFCQLNQLSNLNITQNTELITLYCQSNLLTNIDVSQNIDLKYFYCGNNMLSILNTSNNPQLESLSFGHNQISNIDLSSNPNLAYLYCADNLLSSLMVSQNTNL